jgi:hypothetical protein
MSHPRIGGQPAIAKKGSSVTHRRTALVLILPTGLLVGGAIALSAGADASPGSVPAPATHSAPAAPTVVIAVPSTAPNQQPTCLDAAHPIATGVATGVPAAGIPTCAPPR